MASLVAPRVAVRPLRGLRGFSIVHSHRFSKFPSGIEKIERLTCRAQFAEEVEFDMLGEGIAEDYYSILGLNPFASPTEIKKAYYNCMKACHPDLYGNDPDSVAFCQFINEIYEVLSDPELRSVYDEIKGYSTTGINPFLDAVSERNNVFVDEFSCIGCKNCANTAGCTFEIEPDFGRARVMDQTGDSGSKIQEAIDTCPVECIHWVTAAQLTLLEDEMRRVERVNVGIMLAGQGTKGVDVFAMAARRWQKRQQKAQAVTRARMAKEKGRDFADWTYFWQPAADTEEGEGREEGQGPSKAMNSEKMARVANAARRWRDFSRKGTDRRATKFLGSNSLQEEERKEPSTV